MVPLSIAPPPAARGLWARLAELVDWRDLLGAPGDHRPLLRRPRVLVLLASVVFAFSPLVVSWVSPATAAQPTTPASPAIGGDRSEAQPTAADPADAITSSTAPLPTLSPAGSP